MGAAVMGAEHQFLCCSRPRPDGKQIWAEHRQHKPFMSIEDARERREAAIAAIKAGGIGPSA